MIKNFYTAHDVNPGDVFVVTVKAMVQYDGTYKLYRCPWPYAEIGQDGDPQGDELLGKANDLKAVGETVFPILQVSNGVSKW